MAPALRADSNVAPTKWQLAGELWRRVGGVALAEHLDRLQAWLRELPRAPDWSAVPIVDAASIQYGPVDTIPRDAICTVEVYERRFERHLGSGTA